MTLSVRKVFIDSRYLVSGDSSNFEYELPEVLELPKDTIAFVTEFTTVASWDTVAAGRNNLLYVIESTSSSAFFSRIVTLPTGAYDSETLRLAVENALNGPGKTIAGTYQVARASSAGTVGTANLGAAFRYFAVTISGGGSCFLPQDWWLKKNIPNWTSSGGSPYDPLNLKSSNELFSFPVGHFSATHTSSFIDLRSIQSLFIHSPSFGNYSTLSPGGVRTAIAKVPCLAAYGGLLTYEHSGSNYDYIDVGSTTLKMLEFELKDARGNFVDLKGGNWSMTLVLARR
jgi:hypothetical protein